MSTTDDGHSAPHAPGQEQMHLPAPSLWPIVCAAGLALIAFGLLTHPAFSVVGLLTTLRALAGWIEELRHG
jgi:hypothetical protein